jgi:hypothetical protein
MVGGRRFDIRDYEKLREKTLYKILDKQLNRKCR